MKRRKLKKKPKNEFMYSAMGGKGLVWGGREPERAGITEYVRALLATLRVTDGNI